MAGETVLVVDDSEELRALLEAVLPFGGYRTHGVGSGEEGLKVVPELQPDVILIDLELPDTTGLKVLEELNRLGFTVPTIMMTGYGSEGSAARALRLGVRDYLIKPFTTEEVLSSIERALSESRLRREKDQQTALLGDYARRFKLVQAIGKSMLQGLELDQILRRIVEAALLATRADAGFVLLLDGDPEQLRVVADQVWPSARTVGLEHIAGDERLQPVLREGVPVRLHAEEGCSIEIQTADAVNAVCQVPLSIADQVRGLLAVHRQDRGTAFGQLDEQTLSILANFAAMALDRDSQVAVISTIDDPELGSSKDR
jgi:two-component system NtrC family sensor kinase